jgi:TrmH family RNA methyltransferase
VVSAVEEAELLAAVRAACARLYAAMPRTGQSPDRTDWTGPSAILVGGEGAGIRDSLAEAATPVRIPTVGVESLNVAVACGVLLYEARRQRSRA